MLPLDYEKIEGWCTREKADKLIQLVKESNPKLVVELGVFGGRSICISL
jgi:predicted O-methyltransferase YrrM